ncbi:hypothetical protein ACFFF5_14305 [Lederbergia wuyishanensis]|uniref:Uncharacterized protein n=2 Tax=Lederbergia wuyishanensis TaxID=1347903 RepID=A0ABU0D9K1_9BACI|nr:hypothetical protein [Lederbergia wuyishanensis]MCJ8007462.1 hypothetical protein [Lederbergia wuyishanensis]MDQ0345099.1 hypothetical protein [Lederbergia wuyishanensis]
MKKEDIPSHESELLRALKERPDLEPDEHFTKSLRVKLTKKPHPPKKWKPNFVLYMASSFGMITIAILVSYFLSNEYLLKQGDRPNETVAEMQVGEESEINPLFQVEYGSGESQIGFRQDRTGGQESGISSFFVRDNTTYIIDNVNQKILIVDMDGNKSSFKVNESSMMDIYVDEQKNIYVLDNGRNIVNKYSENGQLAKTYEVDLNIPLRLRADHQKRVIAEKSQDYFMYLETGKKASPNRKIENETLVKRVNDTLGKIIVYETGDPLEFNVGFEESFGGLTILETNPKQIIFAKTEVAAHTEKIITETHVYVMDRKNGNVIGAVRIPIENMQEAPRNFIRADANQIYLLSPEEKGLVVYKLTPGKHFEHVLQDKINTYKKENS